MKLLGLKKTATKYGIFWIPNEELNLFVESWKNKIRNVEPDAVYLSHPVHSTIFLFNGFEEDQTEIINIIKNSKINFLLEGWIVFENDLVTNADTLAIGLKPSIIASEFQIIVATSLLRFVQKPIFYKHSWEGAYKESIQKYGFPFVGGHWIPHLTIASVKNDGKTLIEEAKLSKIILNKEHLEGQIALYKISGENHQHLYTWN